MKYGKEIKYGYLWSFMSPLLITVAFSILGAIYTAIDKSLADAVSAFFGLLILFGFFSILFSGLFCAFIGIPAYYLLRNLGFASRIIISAVGGLVAYLYALIDNQNIYFQGLYVAYGICSGFFFWFGSAKYTNNL